MNEEQGRECGQERASQERSEEFEGLKEHTDGIEHVTFEWNVRLDLSGKAATKTFSSLMMELLLQILGQSARAMTVWMICDGKGVGDIPGV